MNYFAHGRHFVDEPYLLAGSALPDWLSVIDRRLRLRTRHVGPLADSDDPRVASLARGVLRHLRDDRWFHETRAFAEVSLGLSAAVRSVAPQDDSFRPSFLGHVLLELLLDAELIAEDPDRLVGYYRTCERIDARFVADTVSRVLDRSAEPLTTWIPRFSQEGFLWDYSEDEKLCYRLNQVMRRVGLAKLPDSFIDILPDARREVRRRKAELLTGG